MAFTKMGLFFVVLLLSPVTARRCDPSDDDSSWLWKLGAGVAVGAGLVVAAPVAVAAAGFGAGGIAAGSLAAGAMSISTTTGVGMGVVATLQAIGATGALTALQTTIVGGVTTVGVYKVLSKGDSDQQC